MGTSISGLRTDGGSIFSPERQSRARLARRRGRMALDSGLCGVQAAAPSVALMAAALSAFLGGGVGALDWERGEFSSPLGECRRVSGGTISLQSERGDMHWAPD